MNKISVHTHGVPHHVTSNGPENQQKMIKSLYVDLLFWNSIKYHYSSKLCKESYFKFISEDSSG